MVSSNFLASCLHPPLLSEISCLTKFFQNSQSVLVPYTSKSSQNVMYQKKSLISTWKQSKQQARTVNFHGRRTTKSRKLLIFNPGKSLGENKSCNKYSTGNVTKELYLWNYPMNFYQTKSNRNYKYFSFKQ